MKEETSKEKIEPSEQKIHCSVCGREISKDESEDCDGMCSNCWNCWDD
jgi:hypothetical protein